MVNNNRSDRLSLRTVRENAWVYPAPLCLLHPGGQKVPSEEGMTIIGELHFTVARSFDRTPRTADAP